MKIILKITYPNKFKKCEGGLCFYAAYYGYLEILKWAVNNNFHLGDNVDGAAAQNGDLEMLKWLRENACPWNIQVCLSGHKIEHIDCWLRINNCPCGKYK
jgi:hypothetical protein